MLRKTFIPAFFTPSPLTVGEQKTLIEAETKNNQLLLIAAPIHLR